jgi:hypothetical protein
MQNETGRLTSPSICHNAGKIIALDTPANLKKSILQLDILQVEVENFDPALVAELEALPAVEHLLSHYVTSTPPKLSQVGRVRRRPRAG